METPLWLVSSVALLAGCQPLVVGAPCTTSDNCPSGQSCVEGACAATVPVTVTNNGDQTSGALNVMMTSADFVVPATGDCRNFALPGRTSCQLTLAFTPQAAGARGGSLNVSAAPGGVATTTLTGIGLSVANLTLTATSGSSNFGNVLIGSVATLGFVVTNTGQSARRRATTGARQRASRGSGGRSRRTQTSST